MGVSFELHEAFHAKLDKKESGCWNWLGHHNHFGYGLYDLKTSWRNWQYFTTRRVTSHKLAWFIYNGPQPPQTIIRHRCGNPGCCNPEHLRLRFLNMNTATRQFRRYHSRYGVTVEALEDMLYSQECRCRICKRHFDDVTLCIDHCHTTGVVRGLLCTSCNTCIGMARDDTSVLLSAVDYLNETSSRSDALKPVESAT